MTPQEEINVALAKRLLELEERLAGYEVNGLADTFSGTGNQTFGGGVMRLDKNGIQVLANSSDTPALWIVPRLSGTPQDSDQYSVLSGDALASDNYMRLRAKAVTGGLTRQADALVYAEGLNVWSELNAAHDSLDATRWNGAANVSLIVGEFPSNDSAVTINNAPLRLGTGAADPGVNLQDGMLWYQTTSDRFRAYANSITRNLTMDGTNTTLTIATGAVTITTSFHAIDTESAAATDDLDTISGGQTGQVLYIHAANGARDVVAKDGTGNLKLAGDFTMNNTEDVLTLIYDGSNWLELSRSDNGA